MVEAWISAKDRLPENLTPVLCILRTNDSGEYAPWQAVMTYLPKNGGWHQENKPVTSWWIVDWWRPLDWPENAEGYRIDG